MTDTDPGSLDRLHDIVTPPPVPWWPPAPGWLVLAAIALVLCGIGISVLVLRWRRNRYRREAIQLLDGMTPDATSLPAIAELIKRVALAAYPRERVASLSGNAWLEFLDQSGGDGRFVHGAGSILESGTFSKNPPPLPANDVAKLMVEVRYWIRHHQC